MPGGVQPATAAKQAGKEKKGGWRRQKGKS